ncbi:MAG TPA: hypothetical protein VFL80_09555 [Thermoanaerobaculia bacterium]|nr:hypothetical protein [Thermoanaerobaculia bacterium]
MPSTLVSYLAGRPETAAFFLPTDLARSVTEMFPRADSLLPQPYRIFPADETQPPSLGFPVADTPVLKDLDARLDRWVGEETAWQVTRQSSARDKAQATLNSYVSQLTKVAENAMMANLLSDYHAVFWLAHSFDLARHFNSVPRRAGTVDAQAGRTQGDLLKYRVYGRWMSETRDQMVQLAGKAAPVLDGEEQRGLQFFRLLQDQVLIFTEEFIGPDLREVRSFVAGYLRRDGQAFKDFFDRMRSIAVDLLQRDRTFRSTLSVLGADPEQGITLALLLDPRFIAFLFDHPAAQNSLARDDREQFPLIARRLREFAVLNQLRRAIAWMTVSPAGEVASTDRRTGAAYSRATRPMDFGRQGVVDPMVHRFGLIYDISAFSETLGNIQRGGRKEEISSYRQMLLFQRRMETIAERHRLQFEKFLGDGAFYTTRHAMRLVRAAVEIQRSYSDMKRKGFAFNKGIRLALNYGYYRLLPMKTSPDSNDRITEFYGPGIVELSRLSTGKANKEIEDIAVFLIAHGYEQTDVQRFFAPLARGVDVVDHVQHDREFFAYVNATGHLINEGIVASMAMLRELSQELAAEGKPLVRLKVPWGVYVGFPPVIEGLEYIGIRLLGSVSLKGLQDVEVGEITPFAPGEAEAVRYESDDALTILLRQEFHAIEDTSGLIDVSTTAERVVEPEIVICVPGASAPLGSEVLIGEWDPQSDDIRRPLKMPRDDFKRLFSLHGDLSSDLLDEQKEEIRELYRRLSERSTLPAVALGDLREDYETFVIGEVVEKL